MRHRSREETEALRARVVAAGKSSPEMTTRDLADRFGLRVDRIKAWLDEAGVRILTSHGISQLIGGKKKRVAVVTSTDEER